MDEDRADEGSRGANNDWDLDALQADKRDALQAVFSIAPTPVCRQSALLLAISLIAIASLATSTSGPFNARLSQTRALARAQARIWPKKHASISCYYPIDVRN